MSVNYAVYATFSLKKKTLLPMQWKKQEKIVLYIIDRTMSVNYAVYATLSLKKNKNFTSNAMAQKRKIVLHRRTKYSLGRA